MSPLKQLPQIAVAQLGARMHYAVPVILNKAGMLERLYTDAYAGSGSWLHHALNLIPGYLQKGPIARLAGRTAPIPPDKISAFNWLIISSIIAHNRKYIENTMKDYITIGKSFNLNIIKHFSSKTQAVYSYDRSSLDLFKWAKRRGIKCILEQTCQPWEIANKLMKRARLLFPEWADDSLGCFGFLSEIEKEEWQLADLIICPSEFVRQSLCQCGVKESIIRIVPYGINISYWKGTKRSYHNGSTINLLFIGSGGFNKGFPVLIEAARLLNNYNTNFICVGNITVSDSKSPPLCDIVNIIGRVPRVNIKSYYEGAHIFVFPSIAGDGSATVTYEALASGLPVITTHNSGSVVRDGIEGFIIPSCDSQSLADNIMNFIEQPELVEIMSHNALQRSEDFSWEMYGKRLINAVEKLFESD
jgi:glycosyltransferase involved in cell wall biosynthesis